jgi:hypothetical protein
LKTISEKIFEKYNVVVSKSTIDRYISTFNFTLKRISLIPTRRNDERSLEERFIYLNNFMRILSDVDDTKFFFVDEVGFNVSMRTKCGRSTVGSKAVQTVQGLRTRNISVCSII